MTWSGEIVQAELGLTIGAEGLAAFRELAGLSVRRNTKRAHLIVSTVLGKHAPARPSAIRDAGLRLAEQVQHLVDTSVLDPSAVVVVGFAETATALGFEVARSLEGSHYLHSTREPSASPLVTFSEEHSHATAHYLDPDDRGPLANAEVIVLVDDEISTGRTIVNAVSAVLPHTAARRVVIASLIDSRSAQDKQRVTSELYELGIRANSVALLEIELTVPHRAIAAAAGIAQKGHSPRQPSSAVMPGHHMRLSVEIAAKMSGARGLSPLDRLLLAEESAVIGELILVALGTLQADDLPVVIVGVEEHMTVPILAAEVVEKAGHAVLCLSSTRSPVVVLDEPGYAIQRGLAFSASPPATGERYIYNVPDITQLTVIIAPEGQADALASALSVDTRPVLVIDVIPA